MSQLVAFLTACSVIAGFITPVQSRGFAPRDECSSVDGGAEFLRALASAVEVRDADALLSLTTESVLLDFGGTSGREALRKKLANKDYELWAALDEIMTLGCAVSEDGALSLPWYFNQEMGNLDPYDGHLVTGRRVALRAGPSLSSKVVDRISWQPVEADWSTPQEPKKFLRVKTANGQIGYVHLDYLRSFVDYRIRVVKRDGQWLASVIIAGD